ncbi:MAG: hypothetical protein KF777_13645 [Planctomycetaceae bacterium]|nr:hypothetical protein [Planctomycetaceae bacterium]
MILNTRWAERWATTLRFDSEGEFSWARNFARADGIDLWGWAPRLDIDADDRIVLAGNSQSRSADDPAPTPRRHNFEVRGANGTRRTRYFLTLDGLSDPTDLPDDLDEYGGWAPVGFLPTPQEPLWPIRWAPDRGLLFTRRLGAGYVSIGGSVQFYRTPCIMRLRSNFTLDPVPVYFDSGYPVDYVKLPSGDLIVLWNNPTSQGFNGIGGTAVRSMMRRVTSDEVLWSESGGGTDTWFQFLAAGDGFMAATGHNWGISDDDVVPVLLVDPETGDSLWTSNHFSFPNLDDADAGLGMATGLAARGSKVAVAWDRTGFTTLEIFGLARGGNGRVALIDVESGAVEWAWATTRPVGRVAIDSQNRVWASVGRDLIRFTSAGEIDQVCNVQRATRPLVRVTSPWIYERPPYTVLPEAVDPEPSDYVTDLAVDSADGVIAALWTQFWKAPEWL